MAEFRQMDLESKNTVKERANQMLLLFPEITLEGDNGPVIDFDKLRLILGDAIEESDERYTFTWPGKMDAIRLSQTTSSGTLRPIQHDGVGRFGEPGGQDSENLYIEGDNLEVLKLLQRSYCKKIKMIYIDPPYNRQSDLLYRDTSEDSIENYKAQTRSTHQSNADVTGRHHSRWCSIMYPRLRLARELLTEDGVIFVSIDDNEVDNLKKMMDEIFGESNFAARFMWTKTMTPPALSYKSRKTVEYVLCYERIANNSKFFWDWLDNGDAPLLKALSQHMVDIEPNLIKYNSLCFYSNHPTIEKAQDGQAHR